MHKSPYFVRTKLKIKYQKTNDLYSSSLDYDTKEVGFLQKFFGTKGLTKGKYVW